MALPAPAHTTPTPDGRSFRDAIGKFATGVAFITAAPDGKPTGLIVNSLTSVSLDPPLISFCPARSSLTWSADAANEALRSKRARETTRTLRETRDPRRRRPIRRPRLGTRTRRRTATHRRPRHHRMSNRRRTSHRRSLDRRRASRTTYTSHPSKTLSSSSPAHSALCNREQRHAPAGRSSASPRQHVKARPSSGSCTSTYANTRLSTHREQTHEPAPPLPGRPATHRRPSAQSQHRRAPTRQLRQRAANQPPACTPTRPNHRPDRTPCASKPCRCLAHNPQRQSLPVPTNPTSLVIQALKPSRGYPPAFPEQPTAHLCSRPRRRLGRKRGVSRRRGRPPPGLLPFVPSISAADRRELLCNPAAERQCRSHRRAY